MTPLAWGLVGLAAWVGLLAVVVELGRRRQDVKVARANLAALTRPDRSFTAVAVSPPLSAISAAPEDELAASVLLVDADGMGLVVRFATEHVVDGLLDALLPPVDEVVAQILADTEYRGYGGAT